MSFNHFIILISLFTLLTSKIIEEQLPQSTKQWNLKVQFHNKITLKIPSNPTTGYSIFLEDYKGDHLTLLNNSSKDNEHITCEYHSSKTDPELVGAGGFDVCIFSADSLGVETFKIVEKRVWEPKAYRITNVQISIVNDKDNL